MYFNHTRQYGGAALVVALLSHSSKVWGPNLSLGYCLDVILHVLSVG